MLVLGWERWLEAHPWEQGGVLGARLGLHRAPSRAAREPLSLLPMVLTLREMLLTDAINPAPCMHRCPSAPPCSFSAVIPIFPIAKTFISSSMNFLLEQA